MDEGAPEFQEDRARLQPRGPANKGSRVGGGQVISRSTTVDALVAQLNKTNARRAEGSLFSALRVPAQRGAAEFCQGGCHLRSGGGAGPAPHLSQVSLFEVVVRLQSGRCIPKAMAQCRLNRFLFLVKSFDQFGLLESELLTLAKFVILTTEGILWTALLRHAKTACWPRWTSGASLRGRKAGVAQHRVRSLCTGHVWPERKVRGSGWCARMWTGCCAITLRRRRGRSATWCIPPANPRPLSGSPLRALGFLVQRV